MAEAGRGGTFTYPPRQLSTGGGRLSQPASLEGMDATEDRVGPDMGRMGLEELKGLVVTGRLSVAQYYRELDRRGISHA